jgi:RNA polymerase sigma-70 factor (ECF subfamily)
METSSSPEERTDRDDLAESLRARLAVAVRRNCPASMAGQVDDIVHGCVLKVMKILDRKEGNTDLTSSYVWRVAYCAVVDEIRRRRRLREVSIETHDGARDFQSVVPGPEQRAIASSVSAGIRACLTTLSAARRTAVTLHLLGHTVPEIAELLDWNVKRADNLVYRGIDDLRRCLRAKGVTP